jgi:hypothetical protein
MCRWERWARLSTGRGDRAVLAALHPSTPGTALPLQRDFRCCGPTPHVSCWPHLRALDGGRHVPLAAITHLRRSHTLAEPHRRSPRSVGPAPDRTLTARPPRAPRRPAGGARRLRRRAHQRSGRRRVGRRCGRVGRDDRRRWLPAHDQRHRHPRAGVDHRRRRRERWRRRGGPRRRAAPRLVRRRRERRPGRPRAHPAPLGVRLPVPHDGVVHVRHAREPERFPVRLQHLPRPQRHRRHAREPVAPRGVHQRHAG